MSGTAHCTPSTPRPFSSRAGSMEARVSALSTSSMGYNSWPSAAEAKLLSLRMSGRSPAWMRACTFDEKSSQPSIWRLTSTFG